jgi:hypothetical protein
MVESLKPVPIRYVYFVSFFWRQGLSWGIRRGAVTLIKPVDDMSVVADIEAAIRRENLEVSELSLMNYCLLKIEGATN